MTRNYYPFPTPGYWPPPNIPELPPLINPDPYGIWEARDQALQESRSVAPPCNILKVTFRQLRILEVDIQDGTWAGNWEQHLMVRQMNGDPDRVVSVDLADYRTGLSPIRLPIEVPLSYSEFVRVKRAGLADIIRALSYGLGEYIPFTVATGGTAEFGMLRLGTTELTYSENLHADSDWKMGTNTLAGGDGYMSYEVTYEVTSRHVHRFRIHLEKILAEFIQASPARRQSGACIDDRSLWRILQRLGYTVVDDRGSGAKRILELEGPGDFDALCETLESGKRGTEKGRV